jgi:hypothetical protein
VFSISSSFSRLASDTLMPPNLLHRNSWRRRTRACDRGP